MSTKYLDSTGLTYFWNKLKSYFQPTLVSGTNIKTVNGATLLGSGDITISGGETVFYGTCDTAAATTAKEVTCSEFTSLVAGAIILVTFSVANTGAVASLTLNVNGTGAKPIKYINNGTCGNLPVTGYLKASTTYPFIYDGTYWIAVFNYNSTYSAMTSSEMQTGTATTARSITAARLKEAVRYHEVDPVFRASAAYGITSTDIAIWDAGYCDLDTDAAYGTDYELYTALCDLGWDSDCIVSI